MGCGCEPKKDCPCEELKPIAELENQKKQIVRKNVGAENALAFGGPRAVQQGAPLQRANVLLGRENLGPLLIGDAQAGDGRLKLINQQEEKEGIHDQEEEQDSIEVPGVPRNPGIDRDPGLPPIHDQDEVLHGANEDDGVKDWVLRVDELGRRIVRFRGQEYAVGCGEVLIVDNAGVRVERDPFFDQFRKMGWRANNWEVKSPDLFKAGFNIILNEEMGPILECPGHEDVAGERLFVPPVGVGGVGPSDVGEIPNFNFVEPPAGINPISAPPKCALIDAGLNVKDPLKCGRVGYYNRTIRSILDKQEDDLGIDLEREMFKLSGKFAKTTAGCYSPDYLIIELWCQIKNELRNCPSDRGCRVYQSFTLFNSSAELKLDVEEHLNSSWADWERVKHRGKKHPGSWTPGPGGPGVQDFIPYDDFIEPWALCCTEKKSNKEFLAVVDAPGPFRQGASGIIRFETTFYGHGPIGAGECSRIDIDWMLEISNTLDPQRRAKYTVTLYNIFSTGDCIKEEDAVRSSYKRDAFGGETEIPPENGAKLECRLKPRRAKEVEDADKEVERKLQEMLDKALEDQENRK